MLVRRQHEEKHAEYISNTLSSMLKYINNTLRSMLKYISYTLSTMPKYISNTPNTMPKYKEHNKDRALMQLAHAERDLLNGLNHRLSCER